MMDGTSSLEAGLAESRILIVDFSAGGNSTPFRATGWSGQEADSVWTVGPRSTLVLPRPPEAAAFILDLDINPCVVAQAGVLGQVLGIVLNGQSLGAHRITKPCYLRCRVPAELLMAGAAPEGSLTVTLEHPCFVRPDLGGTNKDSRPLAIRFFGLRLYPEAMVATIDQLMPKRPGISRVGFFPGSPPDRPGDRPPEPEGGSGLEAAGHALGDARLVEGWHVGEDGVAWTIQPTCRIVVPAADGSGSYALNIGVSPLVVRDLMPVQRLAVVAEGMLLGYFRLTRETALSIAVPDGVALDGSPTLEITLLLPDAIPMRHFKYGHPDHRLGLALDWLTLQPVPRQVRDACALRGDEITPLKPLAVSERFVELPADEVHAAVQAELGVTPADVMRSFESLGDNCAFGLAQRKAGAEILGLLRFANTSLRALLRGLADGFKAATNKQEIELYLHDEGSPREYMLQIARYGIRWHTLVHEPDADAETVGREQIMKLGFLRRKFDEGLRNGRKTYALVRSEPKKIQVAMPGWGAPPRATGAHGPVQLMPMWDAPRSYEEVPPPLYAAEAIAVLLELNRAGPNTLLYFTLCQPGKRPGTVELLAPGLMRGYMASYVIQPQGENPNDVDWLRVAANAWLLRRDLENAARLTEAA